MLFSKPAAEEHLPYYGRYIDRVQGDVLAFMDRTHSEFAAALAPLSEAQAQWRPAPQEWNIKEIIGHISDTERIFAYRALCIARADRTPLPSYNPDAYIPESGFSARPLANLWQEFDTVRAASLSLIKSFSQEAWLRLGTASDAAVSVRALIYIIAGHEDHHLQSLKDVYLAKAQ